MWRCGFLGLILSCEHFAFGGEADVATKIAQARKELEPRPVTLPAGNYAPAAFLSALAKQTGNSVVDRRTVKGAPPLALDLDKVPFWPALDKFCTLAGCRHTPYGDTGGVALVDGAKRSPHVSYHGITRAAIKRITVNGDLEAGANTCIVYLDVAWEPRFEPFYLGVGPVKAECAANGANNAWSGKAPARGQLPVAGRTAIEVEIQLPAPPRRAQKLSNLEGSFKLLGPSKMLSFRFQETKAEAMIDQEEVSVRLPKVKEGLDRWLIEVQIENPEGTPAFESFQTWLDNNRISLVNGKNTLSPEPNETVLLETNRKAIVQYAFTAPRAGKIADWSLIYRTPGRIVELVVPYRFENVPLP